MTCTNSNSDNTHSSCEGCQPDKHAWKHGRHGHRIGQHFVMPRRLANDALVYGVWVVRTRSRCGEGDIELLAEFRSRLFAKRWARERDERKAAKRG
jgi:hypothetical protein